MDSITPINRHQKHIEKYKLIDSFLQKPVKSNWSAFNKQHEKLSKALAHFMVIASQNNNLQASKLAVDICKTAKKYRMPKFVLEPSRFLYRFYTQYEFDRPKALKAKSLNQWAIDSYAAEMIISRSYSGIILSDRSKHSKKNTASEVDRAWKEALVFFEDVDTFDFRRVAYLIGINYFRQHDDSPSMEQLSREAIAFFQSYPLESPTITAVYYRQLINALLDQNKLSLVDSPLDQYEQILKKAPSQWINYQYTLARIRAVQGNYDNVAAILSLVRKDRKSKSISGINKLAWEILDGYISYMTRSRLDKKGQLILPKSIVQAKNEDMLSERYGIQLLILRLIYYTYNQEWILVESNSTAISKYLSRKLIRSGESRSYNFIQMLLSLSKQRFHPVAVKRHSSRYHTKLMAEPSRALGSQGSYEIIPYERLWKMLMENLKK